MKLEVLTTKIFFNLISTIIPPNDKIYNCKLSTALYFFCNTPDSSPHYYYIKNKNIYFIYIDHDQKLVKHLCLNHSYLNFVEILALLKKLKLENYKVFFVHETKEIKPRILEATPLGVTKHLKTSREWHSNTYVYEVAKLINFPGRKMQKKRNFLNYFYKNYLDQSQVIPIELNHIPKCLAYLNEWLEIKKIAPRNKERMDSILGDFYSAKKILLNWKDYAQKGIMIEINQKVEAIAFGFFSDNQKENLDLYCLKANSNFKGLYQYLLSQLLTCHFATCKLISFGDDEDDENLRKTKLSYQPIQVQDKWDLICTIE